MPDSARKGWRKLNSFKIQFYNWIQVSWEDCEQLWISTIPTEEVAQDYWDSEYTYVYMMIFEAAQDFVACRRAG